MITRLYPNVSLTIRCINLLGDYCAAHVTVIDAHAFEVAQITTINSVYMAILSLRFFESCFQGNTMLYYLLLTQLGRFAKRSPISTKRILSLRARVFNGILSYRQKRIKVNYAHFHRVRNCQEEDYDDAGAIVEGALTEGSKIYGLPK